MEKLGSGRYQCKVCGASVETGPHDDPPLSVLVHTKGRPDQRLVMINGYEIHRCPFPVATGSERAASASASGPTP